MRKINEVKGARFVLEYDIATGQFTETSVPYFEDASLSEDAAVIVQFPEPMATQAQPLRKAG